MADEAPPTAPQPVKKMLMRDHPTHPGGIGSFDRVQGVNDARGFFAISGASAIADPGVVVGQGRCDIKCLGPYGFHARAEDAAACSCGADHWPDPTMGHPIITLANLERVDVVMDVLPYGYILYFDAISEEVEQQALTGFNHPDCAKTLQEILRLLWEYSVSYEEFDDRSAVAVASHAMLQELSPPPEVLTWITSNVPEQAVSRFFRGNRNARDRAQGVPRMGQVADEWVTDHMQRGASLGRVRA